MFFVIDIEYSAFELRDLMRQHVLYRNVFLGSIPNACLLCRRRGQVAAHCGVVGEAATGATNGIRLGTTKVPIWKPTSLAARRVFAALRFDPLQRHLRGVLYGCPTSVASAASLQSCGPREALLSCIFPSRGGSCNAALLRGSWQGLPLLVLKSIPEILVLLAAAQLLSPI